ncbi:MAG: hypothetical protein JWR10_3473 [Rubritepida sp.]|nr:hypothetical protein [Rubritepida sp.]
MTGQRFDGRGIVARLLFGLLLVFSVYNPSGYSFWHWVISAGGNPWAKAFVGVMLLGLHGLIWKSVIGVLQPLGMFFLAALSSAGFVALAELDLLDPRDPNAQALGVMFTLVLLLTAGLSLSPIMHRLSGVQHVEEIPH